MGVLHVGQVKTTKDTRSEEFVQEMHAEENRSRRFFLVRNMQRRDGTCIEAGAVMTQA
jgi:hypothetical protein